MKESSPTLSDLALRDALASPLPPKSPMPGHREWSYESRYVNEYFSENSKSLGLQFLQLYILGFLIIGYFISSLWLYIANKGLE